MAYDSSDVAKAAINLAISSRASEEAIIKELKSRKILGVAVDIGGDFNSSIPKIIERAVVAAKRSGIITECHVHEGAVAGATREVLGQISMKANGYSIGGKIGIARSGEHLSICIFMSIGLLYLNDVVIALAHRAIPELK
ncbi:HutP family protein [Lutispora thermophila]|uniref:Hut operon positive regulatory protein n=1 Tax=Lutispora thermophila DSM 19022 TaxID=1122184 RepID=A0A1M6HZI7_9FIRM|nr:HutP family protein [Lutispora thermophila]SHJ27648.1 HutP protein [Lutispora thermophila DSM 19022]